jgi:hypothetical protein
MDKKLVVCSMALLLGFSALADGCGKSQADINKEWTPAKEGMSRQQFTAMVNEKIKEHQAAVGGTAAGPVPPGGIPAKTQ